MTPLSNIRVIETRLHSHVLEWSDLPLQNELLYLLDELQELHAELDMRDIPNVDMQGNELSLKQRVKLLAARQPKPEFIGNPAHSSLV